MAQTTTALQKLGALPKSDLVAKAARAMSTARSLREDIERSRMPSAVIGSGVGILGGAVAGGLSGWRDEVLGLPIEAVLALIGGTAGLVLRQPLLVHAASGAATVYAANMARDFVFDRINGDSASEA